MFVLTNRNAYSQFDTYDVTTAISSIARDASSTTTTLNDDARVALCNALSSIAARLVDVSDAMLLGAHPIVFVTLASSRRPSLKAALLQRQHQIDYLLVDEGGV